MFEVVFDYGDHHLEAPLPDEPGKPWSVRNDPFSSYRAGFEVRTYRRCQRVLMSHPREEGVSQDCLVRSTDFTYSYEEDPTSAQNPIFSILLSVTQSGYKRQPDGYLKKSLPPLEFEYTAPTIDETLHEIDPESLENLPYGLDNGRYQWVDLDGATGQVKDERIYLGGFEIYRRYGADPLVRETLHIMDDQQRIALVETRTQSNEPGVPARLIRYQFGNHLGSASLELDDQGQIISYEEYYPYGSTAYQAVRSQTETPKRYRYTGMERDEESGFYYHGARYYAPLLGEVGEL